MYRLNQTTAASYDISELQITFKNEIHMGVLASKYFIVYRVLLYMYILVILILISWCLLLENDAMTILSRDLVQNKGAFRDIEGDPVIVVVPTI